MRLPEEFLSCDWGTSSFRLRWVRGESLEVMRETASNMGVKKLLGQGSTSRLREELFAQHLREQLEGWAEAGVKSAGPLPLVISGMASSTVGWKEVPYAAMPFLLDGSGVRFATVEWERPGWVGTTILISGAASADNMMRGEETEALGILGLPEFAEARREALLILPGTHSKHLEIGEGAIQKIRTYMTGELYELLSRESLLKASVDPAALENEGGEGNAMAEFAEGARWAWEHGLPAGLFRTRTRAVLDGKPAGANAWFLSGLLIGAEIADIRGERGVVIVGGAGRLSAWYAEAIRLLGRGIECKQLSRGQAEGAAMAGQRQFLERHFEKLR